MGTPIRRRCQMTVGVLSIVLFAASAAEASKCEAALGKAASKGFKCFANVYAKAEKTGFVDPSGISKCRAVVRTACSKAYGQPPPCGAYPTCEHLGNTVESAAFDSITNSATNSFDYSKCDRVKIGACAQFQQCATNIFVKNRVGKIANDQEALERWTKCIAKLHAKCGKGEVAGDCDYPNACGDGLGPAPDLEYHCANDFSPTICNNGPSFHCNETP